MLNKAQQYTQQQTSDGKWKVFMLSWEMQGSNLGRRGISIRRLASVASWEKWLLMDTLTHQEN